MNHARHLHIAPVILLLLVGLGGCAVSTGEWYDTQRNRETGHFSGIIRLDSSRAKLTSVTVRKGDTYYIIARRNNVSMRALIDANGARPPYALKTGQKLSLPKPEIHVVRRGDTLNIISRRYNVGMSSLARRNNLRAPYKIYVDQKLALPGRFASAPTRVASSKSAKAPTPASSKKTTPVKSASSKNVARPVGVHSQAPSRKGRFVLPVEGKVISSYGPKKGGLHNDGINIAAKQGAPVKASENGVVVYAGNELRGYGNLILVRHRDGWVSAYAHISEFKVKPGDKVKQGQQIAAVGKTGNVDKPQLHFELRRGTRAVDPSQLI